MKKMLTIVGVCYAFYAVAIMVFVMSMIMSHLHLITLNTLEETISFSRYLSIIAFGIIGILLAFFTLLLSVLLIRRKKRKLCLVLAGIFLLEIPFGTILGIFAIIILTSPIIKQEFKN